MNTHSFVPHISVPLSVVRRLLVDLAYLMLLKLVAS